DVLISLPLSGVSTNLASDKSQLSKPIFLNLLFKKSAVTILAFSNSTFSSLHSLVPDKFNSDSENLTFLILDSSKLTPIILQLTNSTLWTEAPLNTVFEKSQLTNLVSVKSALSNSLFVKLLFLITVLYEINL